MNLNERLMAVVKGKCQAKTVLTSRIYIHQIEYLRILPKKVSTLLE